MNICYLCKAVKNKETFKKMAAASDPRVWYLILQSPLLVLLGQLLRAARRAFREKTMTNVKKERGNLEFKRLLSDRWVRSKAAV